LEPREYIDVLYNRKWIIVGTLAVVLAFTLVFTFMQSPTYESKVEILTEVNSASDAVLGNLLPAGQTDTDRFIQDQIKVIQTDALAQAVARQLKYKYEKQARDENKSVAAGAAPSVPGAETLMGMVSVQAGANTGTFDIVITGGDPALTRNVAEAYSTEYLANRQLAAVQQVSEARKEVWNRLTEVEGELQKAVQDAKQYKPADLPADMQAAVTRASDLYSTLYEKYISLRIQESLQQQGIEIIEPARLGVKVGPKRVRNGILAVFVGLFLGLGLALAVDYMDDTLRSREDFERYYDTTIVGEIPFIPSEERPEFHVIYFDKPKHQAAEGFRTLRTNLQFLNLKGEHNIILFTSALPEEGKSTVAASLGAALSEMDKKVLLVDADLRRPTLHKMFDVPSEKGVTGVLAGTASLEESILQTGFDNLYLLPSGVRPPNPGKLAASDEMRSMLERARELFDYVLVDAPPMLAASDASALAPMVDGVLIVGRMKTADRESARRTVEMLKKVEANILGLVINCLETGKRYGYYHYYYYYYDGAPEGQDAGGGKTRGKRHKNRKPAHTTPPKG